MSDMLLARRPSIGAYCRAGRDGHRRLSLLDAAPDLARLLI
ncbi:hypothetical protein [Caballeronia udeis]|nr:hypothetical protein [Caballeronia udeis]